MTRRAQSMAGGLTGQSHWRPAEPQPTIIACTDVHKGPHNRCQHPTPAPVGHTRCAGDPGCPYLIADRYRTRGVTRCPWHSEHYDTDAEGRYRSLMAGGRD